jgi:thymidine kinase
LPTEFFVGRGSWSLSKEGSLKMSEFPPGRIEVVTGSMFSGKSEELLRRLRRAKIAKKSYLLFKPKIDDRWGATDKVVSHIKSEMEAIVIDGSAGVIDLTMDLEGAPHVEVVGIDEVQFFDRCIVHACEELANKGVRVIVAGLDMDWRGLPFGPMAELLARAERVDKLQAICTVCGGAASFTQKLTTSTARIEIGAEETYTARCRRHYEPPKEQ